MKKDLSRHTNWMTTKDRLNALKATFFYDALDLSESEKTKKKKIFQACILYLFHCKITVLDNILLSGQFNLNFKCCHFMHSRATGQVLNLEGI